MSILYDYPPANCLNDVEVLTQGAIPGVIHPTDVSEAIAIYKAVRNTNSTWMTTEFTDAERRSPLLQAAARILDQVSTSVDKNPHMPVVTHCDADKQVVAMHTFGTDDTVSKQLAIQLHGLSGASYVETLQAEVEERLEARLDAELHPVYFTPEQGEQVVAALKLHTQVAPMETERLAARYVLTSHGIPLD